MPNRAALSNPEKPNKEDGHPAAWLFVSLAALLLAYGGLSDLDRTMAIWIRCSAGVSTALALIFDPKLTFSGKKIMAAMLIAISLVLGVFLQNRPKAPMAYPQSQTALTSSSTSTPNVEKPDSTGAKVLNKVPPIGSASSTGDQSPAVTGSGNRFAYGATKPPDNAKTAPPIDASKAQPSGSASSTGTQSPAVSGSGNSFTYGSSEPPRKKKDTGK